MQEISRFSISSQLLIYSQLLVTASRLFGVLMVLVLCSACVSESQPANKTPNEVNTNNPAANPSLGECSEQEPIKRPALTRLSNVEYSRSLRDLFDLDDYADISSLPQIDNSSNFLLADSATIESSENYQILAEHYAKLYAEKLLPLKDCAENEQDQIACVKAQVLTLAERAYRAPLNSSLEQHLLSVFNEQLDLSNLKSALTASVELILQSPFFLYRSAGPIGIKIDSAGPEQFINASRLSYLITGSIPDELLWTDAKSASLNQDKLLEHAKRLLSLPGNQAYLSREFLSHWFNVKWIDNTRNDISDEQKALLIIEAFDFINEQAWGNDGGLDKLIQSEQLPLGVFSLPAWHVNYSYADRTAPIRRGAYLAEHLLCRDIPEFKGNVEFPMPTKGLTLRERLKIHREQAGCASCHDLFDFFGIALENYDQYGQWRDSEDGLLIDASGTFSLFEPNIEFKDSEELFAHISDLDEFRQCAVKQWQAFAYRVALPKQLSCQQKKLAEQLRGANNFETMILELLMQSNFFAGSKIYAGEANE